MPSLKRTSFAKRHEGLWIGSASLAVLITVWEMAWRADLISPLFFSGPSAIAVKFAELLASGKLLSALMYTGGNFLVGFALAIAVGVPFGILLGWYRRLF